MAERRNDDPTRDRLRPVRRLSVAELEALVACCLRMPNMLLAARDIIEPREFRGGDEAHLRLLWERAVGLTRTRYRDGRIPRLALEQDIRDGLNDFRSGLREALRAERRGSGLPDPDESDLDEALEVVSARLLADDPDGEQGMIAYAYDGLKDGDFDRASVQDLARRFHAERAVYDEAARLFRAAPGQVVDVGDVLERVRPALTQARTIGVSPIHGVRPRDRALYEAAAAWPSGLPYFDVPIGNLAAGESYGLIGPSGKGKTMLSINLAVAAARQLYAGMGPPGDRYVYYFFYELTLPQIQQRFWSPAAQVDYRRFDGIDLFEPELDSRLSASDWEAARRPLYERDLARSLGVRPDELPGERERLAEAMVILDARVKLVEMSGDHGWGGAEEVDAILAGERAEGRLPALIVIDWIGQLAGRHLLRKKVGRGDRQHQFAMQDAISLIVDMTKRYECCALIVQQLAGAETKKAATARLHYSDSAEDKSFANLLDYCGLLGNRDLESQCQILTHSKCRRTGFEGTNLIRFDRRFGLFVPADDQYEVENGAIVERSRDITLGGGLGPGPAPARPRTRATSFGDATERRRDGAEALFGG